MLYFHMTQKELNSYPTAPLGDKDKERKISYVLSIIEGDSKEEAYKKFFPEQYAKVGKDSHRLRNAIYSMENGEFVSKMMATANKQAYSRFFGKVNKVLDRAYNIALDEEQEVSHSLKAMDTFMKHVPKQAVDIEVKVEVDIKDQYKTFLADRKKFMHELANGDAIDVEIEQ